MALSDDQRAMLRLLAQREQGYDDIAALMGLSVDELRARVDEALAELEREPEELPEPAEPPAAEPPPPAPPEPAAEPPSPAPSAPAAEPPPLAPPEPAAEQPSPVGAATKDWRSPPAGGGQRPGLPRDPGARAAIVAGLLALVAIVVVLIVGGGDDDGDGSSGAGQESGDSAGQVADGGEAAEPTEAILKPVNGSGASGTATFGNLDDSLALLVEAEGLEATGKGQSYAIWLAENPKRMVPVGEIPLEDGGKLSTQVPLPVELLAFIANESFTEVAITLANSSRLEQSVEKATEEEKEPEYTGEAVLRGTITGPIVGAELPEEESK